MKKLFSTILAVMVAVVMSFAVFAFTGCDPTNQPDNNPENGTKPATGLVTGNATYDSIIGTEFAGAKLDSTVSMGGVDATVKATVNTNGKADIALVAPQNCMYYFVRDWKVYGTESKAPITDFSEAELEGYIDINQALEAVFEFIGENGGEAIPEGISDIIKLNDVLGESLNGVNYALLSLADAANAVTVADTTVTIDFNKMAYNMVNQVKAGVATLKGDTTIGDLLGNATLKKYAQIVTELVSTKDVTDFVAGVVEALGKLGSATLDDAVDDTEDAVTAGNSTMFYQSVAAVVELVNDVMTKVQPDENSSVYDYIVKVLSSQELVDAINGLLQKMGAPAGSGLTKKITEFTLDEILTMGSAGMETPLTFDGVKEMLNTYIDAYTSGITETALTVFDEDEEIFSLTGASLVYTYGENGLTAMDLDLNLDFGDGFEMGIDATLTLSKTAYADSEFATLPAELPEIEDIDFGDLVPGPSEKYVAMLSVGTTTVSIDPYEDFCIKVYLSEEYEGQEVQLRISSDDYGLGFAVENNSLYVNPLEVTYSEDLIIDARYFGEAEDGLVHITIEIVNGNGNEEDEYTLSLGDNTIVFADDEEALWGVVYSFTSEEGGIYTLSVDEDSELLVADQYDEWFDDAFIDINDGKCEYVFELEAGETISFLISGVSGDTPYALYLVEGGELSDDVIIELNTPLQIIIPVAEDLDGAVYENYFEAQAGDYIIELEVENAEAHIVLYYQSYGAAHLLTATEVGGKLVYEITLDEGELQFGNSVYIYVYSDIETNATITVSAVPQEQA